MSRITATALAVGLVGIGVRGSAEPIFLSKQYNRCTACHYSATGGGLLTPYGRSLSRQEISTTGKGDPALQPAPGKGEEAFLWGALGNALGPVNVGIDLRPSHLTLGFGQGGTDRNLLMTGDLMAAWRANGWTVYGEFGRQPRLSGTKWDSYEHWLGYQSEKSGFGFRAGRFMPAYGVRLADHTAFNRAGLGFDYYGQVYAVELSHTNDRHLLQVSLGPGLADSIEHNDGHRSFTATARYEQDLTPRTALVFSGLYRASTTLDPANGATGVALGIAPTSRLTIWSQADVRLQGSGSGIALPGSPAGTQRAYTLLNETSFEVYRGLWLKVSPQLETAYGDSSGGVFRLVLEANLLPRTHWNVDVSYYHDKARRGGLVFETLLAQLHLYI